MADRVHRRGGGTVLSEHDLRAVCAQHRCDLFALELFGADAEDLLAESADPRAPPP
ncbi:MAG: hypothetical protein IPG69_15680 [Flavobacteriales bacterium]|nr:hypothetical protein [Flavobacteriales bacterium]